MAATTLTTATSQPVFSPRLQGSAEASRSGIWVGIFAIIMSFAALTSSLLVRQGSGEWSHIVIPSLLYANTAALLLSSFTMEMARRALAKSAGPSMWLTVTLVQRIWPGRDRKSTRLNSSHANISYAVFCLKKKKQVSHRRVGLSLSVN